MNKLIITLVVINAFLLGAVVTTKTANAHEERTKVLPFGIWVNKVKVAWGTEEANKMIAEGWQPVHMEWASGTYPQFMMVK